MKEIVVHKSKKTDEQQRHEDRRMGDALDTINAIPNKKMALSIFVGRYLPFFNIKGIPNEMMEDILAKMSAATGRKCEPIEASSILMNLWAKDLGGQGAFYQRVDIFDDRDPNRPIVYTVPPLMDGSNGGFRPDVDEKHVENELSKARMLYENKYTAEQDGTIDKVTHLLAPGTLKVDDLRAWNVIFKHHNMALFTIPGEVEPEEATAAEMVDGEEFERF